jgi:hypothetical protein
MSQQIKEVTEAFKEARVNKMKRDAQVLYEKYPKQCSYLESKSLLSKVRPVEYWDIYGLGKMLEQFSSDRSMWEADGNVGMLGVIPNIAFDVLTVTYGSSIIPLICSVQPIEEEQGTIYFKQVRSATLKGNLTATQTILDPRSIQVTPNAFASNYVSGEVGGHTADNQVAYTLVTHINPVRPRTFSVAISELSVSGVDDGSENISGIGCSGTIVYSTGVVTLTLTADPGAAYHIVFAYQVNYELATTLPNIDTYYASQTILAKVFALRGTVGLLMSYGLRKRFGLVAEDELAKDLINEINAEIGGSLIRMMYAAAKGSTTWDQKVPTSVSWFEHQMSYKKGVATAEKCIVQAAGRGTISGIVVGISHSAIFDTLPGFEKLTDGNTLGPHLYGTFDGKAIIRVPEDAMLDEWAGMAFWKGTSPFEAPAVYSPFMPLVVTDLLPIGLNPLGTQRAAAVWAGLDVLVSNFITKLDVVDTT